MLPLPLLPLLAILVGNSFATSHSNGMWKKSTIKDAPWSVLYGNCGGVILRPMWILTAAHCGYQEEVYIKIRDPSRLGWNQYEVMDISRDVVHPRYDSNTRDFDFLLVKLSESIEVDNYARTITIGAESLIRPGNNITVVSWGEEDNRNLPTTEFWSLTLPIVDHNYCKVVVGDVSFSVSDRTLCAGFEVGGAVASDTCRGESGGGVTVDGELVGLVSWGDACARPGVPAVYANVVAVKEWIDMFIEMDSIADKAYGLL